MSTLEVDQTPAAPTANVAMRGSMVTLAGQWTRLGLQAASLTVLARLLTPSDFGIVAMVISIVGIAAIIGDFGLSLAAVQARELSQAQKSNLFWMNVLLGVTIGAICFALADPIANYYHEPEVANVVRALSSVFVLNGLVTQFHAQLTRNLRFGRLAMADVSAQALGLVVALVMAYLDCGYWALVGQQATVATTSLLVAAAVSGWMPGLPGRAPGMGAFVSFGAGTVGVQAIAYISNNIDSVFVGRYWGSAILGIYNRAFDLFTLPMTQLAAPLTRVALPILSRIDDRKSFMHYLSRAQLMLTYGLVGAFAVAASVAQPLIAIALGPGWQGVVPIFHVLAIGGVFQALSYVYYWAFLARGEVGVQFRASVVGRAIMVVTIFIGAHIGPVATAAGSAVGLFVLWVIYSAWGMRKIGFRVAAMNIEAGRAIALFAVMAVAAQVVIRKLPDGTNTWLALLAGLVTDAVCLLLAALLVRPVREDLKLVWRLLGTMRGRKPKHAPRHAYAG